MVTLTTFDGGSFVIDRDVAACCEFFNRGVEGRSSIFLCQCAMFTKALAKMANPFCCHKSQRTSWEK